MAGSDSVNFLREATRGRNPFILRLATVAAIGGFLFGYDTGVVSGALLFIKHDLHAGNFEQQAIVGSLLLGAVAGAIIAGYSADAISRKWTKVIAALSMWWERSLQPSARQAPSSSWRGSCSGSPSAPPRSSPPCTSPR